jgi:lipoprotein-anchoring transpeptidase ErfK/SrfK
VALARAGGAGTRLSRLRRPSSADGRDRYRRAMARRSGLLLLVAAVAVLAGPFAALARAADPPRLSIAPELLGADGTVLAGRQWRVRVVMRPAVPGQAVTVRFLRAGRELGTIDVALAPSSSGRSASAVVPFGSGQPGVVEVRASHAATAEQVALEATPVHVRVRPIHASPGARGPVVRLLQRQLAALGYVVGAPGRYDARTARAVLAFRKVTGMARTEEASNAVYRALAGGAGRFPVRFPGHGKHVEADLSLQVLALVRGGRVERVYPISSGKPSTPSPIGSFRVYLKTPGTNAKGMVFSSYFLRGYAVHGYAQVPVFAASHGCLRVPIPDAVSIFSWLAVGDRVDVRR